MLWPPPWRPDRGRRGPAWPRRSVSEGSPSRDQAQTAVFFDQGRVSLGGVPVAAGPGQLERDHVAVAKVDRGLAADLVLLGSARVDHGAAERARFAAQHPEGTEAAALREIGELHLLCQDADVPPDAQAAAMAAPPARVRDELEPLPDERG